QFVFRAHSFRNGASWSLLGVLLLLVGASNRARRTLAGIESRLEGPARRVLTVIWPKSKTSIMRMLIAVESALSALSKSKIVMIVALIGLLIYGCVLVKFASYAAGGSDSSGYIRIARSILRGNIVQRVTELDLLGLPDEFIRNFLPLSYDPG